MFWLKFMVMVGMVSSMPLLLLLFLPVASFCCGVGRARAGLLRWHQKWRERKIFSLCPTLCIQIEATPIPSNYSIRIDIKSAFINSTRLPPVKCITRVVNSSTCINDFMNILSQQVTKLHQS